MELDLVWYYISSEQHEISVTSKCFHHHNLICPMQQHVGLQTKHHHKATSSQGFHDAQIVGEIREEIRIHQDHALGLQISTPHKQGQLGAAEIPRGAKRQCTGQRIYEDKWILTEIWAEEGSTKIQGEFCEEYWETGIPQEICEGKHNVEEFSCE